MKQNAFYEFFVELLKDIFNAENQILKALPRVIKNVKNADLKKALSKHLDETEGQVSRLKTIFQTLNESPSGVVCEGMKGILAEGDEVLAKKYPAIIQDVALIIACQKVEHYEIASYGSARALARHLSENNTSDRINYDEIADLLQETLDEESNADETLTDLAEGGFFTVGLNDEAEHEATESKSKE
jgi:ferritin-like metal-binding protein YciE